MTYEFYYAGGLLKDYWWLVDWPYWFKAGFLPKILGIYTKRGEIDIFYARWDLHEDLSEILHSLIFFIFLRLPLLGVNKLNITKNYQNKIWKYCKIYILFCCEKKKIILLFGLSFRMRLQNREKDAIEIGWNEQSHQYTKRG